MITLNRREVVKKTLDKILNNTGLSRDEWELLVVDNGSTDGVDEYINSLKPKLLIKHHENKGVAHSLNKLIKKASGDYICHIGNDIEMDDGWLKGLLDCHKAIPQTGIAAIHTVEALHPIANICGVDVHLGKGVFGPKMFRRELVKDLAYKEWSKYGLEDSDLALRFYYQGLYNYYIPGIKGKHVGDDVGENSEYRKMKWQELEKAQVGFNLSIKEYRTNDRSNY
jgi:glycosyltransferase involved in cell wall biosynthesis